MGQLVHRYISVVQLATRELSDTPELYRAYCASGWGGASCIQSRPIA
jgi:hypothetical protein